MILRTQLTGARAVEREIQNAATEFTDTAYDRLLDYGAQLRSLTRQLAPQGETGFLGRNVKIEYLDDDSGWEVGWFSEDFEAAGLDPYYWYVEFGTQNTEAQPSLTVAWADLETQLAGEMELLLARAFAA